MRRTTILISLGGLILNLLWATCDCRAELSVRPGILLRLEATDNLYLSETSQNREMIGTVAPGVNIEQTGRYLNLEIDYAYEMYRFLNEPSLNSRPDSHIGQLDGTILPERDFSILLFSEARRQALDRRLSDIDNPLVVNTIDRYSWLVRPTYRFELGSRNSGEVNYGYEAVEYDDPNGDDSTTQQAELQFTHRLTPRLDLSLSGTYELRDAEINQDYDRTQGMAGGEWRPFNSTTLSIMAGVARFEYQAGNDFDSRVVNSSLNYAPAEQWRWELTYVEDFLYDVRDGLYEMWRGELALAFSSRLSWRLTAFAEDADYLQVAREEKILGGAGEATYQLSPRVVLGASGDFRTLEFAPVNEKVNRYSAGVSIEYTPREFINMGCRYVYRSSDSDIDLNDYTENRATCDLRLSYGLIP